MNIKDLNKKLLLAIRNEDLEKISEISDLIKIEKERLTKQAWIDLKSFKNIFDVPQLPIPLTEFHNKKLIECGAIPKKDLIKGQKYLGRFRVTDTAIWNGEVFEYENYNFGQKYIEECNHFEDDNGLALFVPLKKI